jgi:hypothetical protein
MYAIWGETLMKRAEVNLLLEKVYTFILDAQRVSGKFFNSPALHSPASLEDHFVTSLCQS